MNDKQLEINIKHPEDVTVTSVIALKKHLEEDHLRVFCASLHELAADKELTGTDLRVLLEVLSKLQYENFLDIPQQKLADSLKIKQQEIAKSLKKLVNKEYLIIIGKKGRQNVYRLNPYFGFKSRARHYSDLCEDWQDRVTEQKLEDEGNVS